MACKSPNLMAVSRYSDGINIPTFLGPYKSELVTSVFRDTHRYQLIGSSRFNGRSQRDIIWDTRFFLVQCRLCQPCRKARALDMATRCMLDIKYYSEVYDLPCQFITLTYSDEFLPPGKTLCYDHFQLFMKSYRRWLDYRGYGPIKFFMCGEYGGGKGERVWNPHYHAIIFGHAFSDLYSIPQTHTHGTPIYGSHSLSGLWKKGFVTVGEANIKTARYVANYIHKKDFGPRRDEVYEGRVPEMTQGSKRKAIGLDWLQDHFMDLINSEELVIDGERYPIPNFYIRKLNQWYPGSMYDFKQAREIRMFDEMDKQLLSGESPLAKRVREGTFSEIIHSQTFRRSYEECN